MSMPPLEGESEFFEALGRAIAAWQNIEVALAYLFAAAMPEPKATRSLIVFDTVQNFRDKLSITDAVLRETLIDAPCLETWNTMLNKLPRLAKRRNRIPHAHVVQIHVGEKMHLFASPPFSKIPPGAALADSERRRIFRDSKQLVLVEHAFKLAAQRLWELNVTVREELARREA